jgi:hypothetical protein
VTKPRPISDSDHSDSEGVLSVVHWNVQGVIGKEAEMTLLSLKFGVDILCICEHWLSNDELKAVHIPGFYLASSYCRSSRCRGGSAIFIRSGLVSEELCFVVDASVRLVCEVSAVFFSTLNLICLELYRIPDDSNFDTFIDVFSDILLMLNSRNKTNASIILCGDFNVDILNNSPNPKKYVFLNLLLGFNLVTTFLDVTRPSLMEGVVGTCIDNIATSIHSDRIKLSIVEPMAVSDHCALIFKCLLQSVGNVNNKLGLQKKLIRPIENLNSCYFTSLLSKVNWLFLYTLTSIDEKFDYFFSVFLNVVNVAFPVKYIAVTGNKTRAPKWYSHELKDLKLMCLDMYQEFKLTGSLYAKNQYKNLKSNYKNEIVNAKLKYNCDRVLSANNKPKAIWSVINEFLNDNDKLGRSRCDSSNSFTPLGFNEAFLSNVQSVVENVPNSSKCMSYYLDKLNVQPMCKSSHFNFSCVSVEDVYRAIHSLSNSPSLDVYCINSSILKLAAPFIAEVLGYLFNLCIEKAVFPQCMKYVKVVPLYKAGKISDYNNYRPVSIVPVISKVFEVLLNFQIVNYFETNLLFSDCQYGFRPNKGTCKAIVDFMKCCIHSIDVKNKVLGRFYDMSKAFDTISHAILVDKLSFYGFDNSAVSFIKSYLSQRYQAVYLKNCLSQYLSVKTGVPQGSILGPVLFIVYINDLAASLITESVKPFVFADDLAIQVSLESKSISMAVDVLDEVDRVVQDWTAANSLCLNQDKTKDLVFNLSDHEHVTSVKFLGVHVQTNVKWNVHVEMLCKRVARGNFMLYRLSLIVSTEVLVAVYYAHIHSHLSYAVLAWGNDSSVRKLLILQKRAIRVICNVGFKTHCKPLFRRLKILTVPSIFILECLLYIKENLNLLPTNSVVHGHHTRNCDKLRVGQYNFCITQANFLEIGKKFYNSLPTSFKLLSSKKFKVEVKSLLLQISCYNVNDFVDHVSSISDH